MSTDNAIGILFAVIMTIGLVSVLCYGFRIQDNIKKFNDELANRYVPELIRPPVKKPTETEEVKEVEPKEPFWLRMWYRKK